VMLLQIKAALDHASASFPRDFMASANLISKKVLIKSIKDRGTASPALRAYVFNPRALMIFLSASLIVTSLHNSDHDRLYL